ncbi:CRTAC1 family protein [Nannocystaceae bacterium ST9]
MDRRALALSLVLLPGCPVAPTVYAESTLAGADEAGEDPSEAGLDDDAAASEAGGLDDPLGEAESSDEASGEATEGPPPSDLPDDRPSEQIVFTEVAAAAGLDYVHSEFQSAGNCLVDTVTPPLQGWFCSIDWSSGGAAAADFDEDGWVDLFVTRPYAPDLLFRNQGDGSFVDVAASVGLADQTHHAGAAWADIDNDGDLDLYVTTIGEPGHELFVNHAGYFFEEAEARGAALIDGYPQTGTTPAFGDYDNDGWLDLYVGDWHTTAIGTQPSHARLLHNRGEAQPGMFDDVTIAAGVDVDLVHQQSQAGIAGTLVFSAGFADMDADGWLDLLLASDFGCSRLFWNQGDGAFLDTTFASGLGTDENGMGSAIGDWDRDGDLDWFVSSISGPIETGNRLYAYAGDRQFVDATDLAGVREGGWGWGAAFFDQDNDADLDLVMTNGWRGTLYLDDPMVAWTNPGDGAMVESPPAMGFVDQRQGRALLTFDYDRDGDLDVFVANGGAEPELLRNDSVTGNHWLQLDVRGTASNRDAIGARVWVTAGGITQVHEIGGSSHFLGHSERVAHFGLGGADEVEQVRVVWPASGAERVLNQLAVDQRVLVLEP